MIFPTENSFFESSEVLTLGKHIDQAPINLDSLLSDLKIDFEHSYDLPGSIRGYIKQQPEGKYKITVNLEKDAFRQRFTTAHLLGHYFLHRLLINEGVYEVFEQSLDNTNYNKGKFNNPDISKQHELEADQFAIRRLMPMDSVLGIYSLNPDLEYLADKFTVPKKAMKSYLEAFDLKI